MAPARYLSALAFAGAVPGGATLYLELLHEVTPGGLVRDYRGWLAEREEWRELLRLRDTLPVPRAAWRILPGDGLEVLVGSGPEIVGLLVADSTARLRLLPGPVIAEWTGPTGQREFLAHASLARDSLAEPGFLFFRRAARPAGAPRDRGGDELFLLADARGGGLLVARTDTVRAGGPAVIVRSWFDGISSTWPDAVLEAGSREPRPGGGAGAPSWSLDSPTGLLAAELHGLAERPGFILLTGTLRRGGERSSLHGIQLHTTLP
ncbi:MAG: hypothetical protein ACE5HP_08700 [Gemmatimonadota bacterium]